MERFASYVIRRHKATSGGLLALTALALVGAMRLHIDPANASLFLRHSQAYRTYQHFLDVFGPDDTIVVVLHDPSRSIQRDCEPCTP